MLAHYGDEAGIYAGGTELLLAMKHQALNYRHLIDVKVVPGLDSIDLRNGSLEIGATSTHRSIERSALVRQKQPVLAELESHVANVRVRATGTLGGNLCFAEPHSDPATLLLVLGGTVRLESAAGIREMPVDEFHCRRICQQSSAGRNPYENHGSLRQAKSSGGLFEISSA